MSNLKKEVKFTEEFKEIVDYVQGLSEEEVEKKSKPDYRADFMELMDFMTDSDFNSTIEKYLFIGYLRSLHPVVKDDEECYELVKRMEKTLYPDPSNKDRPLYEDFQQFREEFCCMIRGLSF